jgi:hypothetical protein
MPRCILHIGMPKTGSTSIQESLYHGLRGSGFRYVSFGEVNGERLLLTCFGDDHGQAYHHHQKLGLTGNEISRLRDSLIGRLDGLVERSRRRGDTLVFSAETAWAMSRDEFAGIRNYFGKRGYAVDVFVYLRSWKSWLESNFQERIKQGERSFEVLPETRRRYIEYGAQLEGLDAVFGSDHVFPAWFWPQAFPQRCVVLDFCRRSGIPLHPRSVRRVNDGMSLDALKLLLAHRRWNQGYGVGLNAVIRNEMLFRRLREVGGPPVRFHSTLVKLVQSAWLEQIPVVERRLGSSLLEDVHRDDGGECLREESQLAEFSRPSLDWLGKATGSRPLTVTSGGEAVREVGEQMQHLLQHPSLVSQWGWHRMIFSRRLAHWTRGV